MDMEDEKINPEELRLYTSIDDSSDEEDSVEGYDIQAKFKKYIDYIREGEDSNYEEKLEGYMVGIDTALSFVTHATGIYALYSLPVQKRYYELKKDKLRTKLYLKGDEEINNDIEASINKIKHYSSWCKDRDPIKTRIVETGFDIMRIKTSAKITKNKVKYCSSYIKEHNLGEMGDDYIYSIFKKLWFRSPENKQFY